MVTVAVAVLLVVAASALGFVEWRVARRRGWNAGYRAAETNNKRINAAVYKQLSNFERVDAAQFERPRRI